MNKNIKPSNFRWFPIVASWMLLLSAHQPLAQEGLSSYDQGVLKNSPIMYLTMSNARSATDIEPDLSGNGHSGSYHKAGKWLYSVYLPNRDLAARFDGIEQYLNVSDSDDLSIATTGSLTLEAWMRPTELEFPNQQGSGFVHWLGKGVSGQHEYAFRIYSRTTSDSPPRPNRISGYAFNLSGGLGSGSYFQDDLMARGWVHVVVTYTTENICSHYPSGRIKIYRDGVLRHTAPMNQYGIIPENGTAPFRVGTRDLGSFFLGAVAKVAVYNYELPASQVAKHYNLMMQPVGL